MRQNILQVKSLSIHHPPKETNVIKHLSFSVKEGSCLAIIGESGCGKSSLLRCLGGLHTTYEGSIEIQGSSLSLLKERHDLHRHVSFIWQNPRQALNPLMSVSEILSEPFKIQKKQPSEIQIQKLLNSLFLPSSILKKYPPELSGGQCQMVAILRALATSAKILLLDEPSSSLDYSSQAQLIHTLKKMLAELSLTIIFSSHDLQFAYHLATHAAILRQGSFIEHGDRDSVFYQATHPYAQKLQNLFLDQC